MEYLNSLYLPGALAMWCALLFALTSVWGYSQALQGDRGAVRFARRAYNCYTLAIILAAAVLGFALMTRDFRIEYVYQYSGLELPAHYQLAAFWAGQKGSFLIWLFWAVLLGVPLYRSAGKRQEPTVMIVYLLTTLGLLFILVRESPFVMLGETPTDGKGLNPLLQDDWMVIHPPIMFIGYAASAMPFAFAMAALWRKDSEGWARRAFPWALGGFMVLGLAILMGGYWAYKTLGWGGFWGWDPVENASLIPWLFGTILIHGLYLERTRNRYRRANYVLATLVFLAVLYGTFLTRSGVLADFSVHSFVDLGISGWLVGMMAFFGIGAAVLLATRLRSVETRPNEDPLVSRGTAVVLGTIAVLLSAIVVTFGTSAPLLTAFMENPGQVGPEWYNRVNLPIAILIGMLLAVVPYLTWRKETTPGELAKKLLPSAVFAVLVTGLAVAVAFRQDFFPPSVGWFFSREAVFPFYLFFGYVFFASLALASNVHKTVSKARLQGLRAAGGYLSHVGVGIMLLGFIGSGGFDHSTKVSLQLDQPKQVGERTLTFVGFLEKTSPRDKDTLVIDVETADGDTFRSYPRFFRNERSGQLMMNPHVRTTPLADFYVSPLQYDPGEAPGAGKLVELSQGQSLEVGDYTVRFADFDLSAGGGNFMTEMASGRDVALGVRLDVTGPDGATGQAVPLYRILQAQGMVETPPAPLPAGGTVRVAGVSPRDGLVRLALAGVPGLSSEGTPPTLSVDVTEKPLIQLVWFGLYVVLAGGGLAIFQRMRQALSPVAATSEPAEEA